MSRLVLFLDRLLVFFTGVLLALAGAFSVGLNYDCPTAQRIADQADLHSWLAVPEQSWYISAVVAVGVLALLVMVLVLGMNLRSNRIRRVATSSTDATGSIDLDLSAIAAAAADSFTILPKVVRANSVVKRDYGHRLMTITVTSDPQISLPQLREHAEQTERDIREAIGTQDLEVQFRFHMSPVERKPM